jgi:hypothetical protein
MNFQCQLSARVPLQLQQWDDAIGPGLVLADDRRRGDDRSPHEFALAVRLQCGLTTANVHPWTPRCRRDKTS